MKKIVFLFLLSLVQMASASVYETTTSTIYEGQPPAQMNGYLYFCGDNGANHEGVNIIQLNIGEKTQSGSTIVSCEAMPAAPTFVVDAEFIRCPQAKESLCARFYGVLQTGGLVQVSATESISQKLLDVTQKLGGRFTIARKVEVQVNPGNFKVINLNPVSGNQGPTAK